MDWRSLPSLAALRAFEAAARLESVTAAADALNVTHAAISQHIRALEADLGTRLVTRKGRSIGLTAEGARLATALTDGFETVADAVAELRTAEDGRPLAVSLTPMFAETWLMPRLSRFWKAHPESPVALHPDQRLVDLRRDAIDLAIRFGDGNWPGTTAELLVEVNFAVVGLRGLLPEGAPPEDFRSRRWFFEETQPEFRRWAENQGYLGSETPVEVMSSTQLVRAATRQGYGFSVGFPELDLQDHPDLRVYHQARPDPERHLGYHLVTRPGAPSARLEKLLRWLRREARQTPAL